jgi:hypothetical protein
MWRSILRIATDALERAIARNHENRQHGTHGNGPKSPLPPAAAREVSPAVKLSRCALDQLATINARVRAPVSELVHD